ncbi:hypothetical protein DID88_004518 [Monilinia fructigena]|uniref:Histone chaperone domain-containing protein n=1 Tax=Monilinia fructigena TaxID=38457 RepID=A0A395IQT2_9HELO|nr:hypothetical protein DID88_004518 [Monilinia fructigena]
MDQGDINAMDNIEESIAEESMLISDEDIDDEEDVELEDEVEQNSNAEENSMGSMMEREGARRKTGESRYDAIVLDDLD